MGLRGVCGAGAAGCMWIGGCSTVVAPRWIWSCHVLETLLSLEVKGSSEGILNDEIYIMIIEK